MKIAVLCHRLDKASFVHRLGHLKPLVEGQGGSFEAWATPKEIARRAALCRSLGAYDVVVIARKLFGWPELWYIRRQAQRLVFDFDDAIMYRSQENDSLLPSSRGRLFRRTVRTADHVVCGNEYLRQLTPGSQAVTVIETPVDPNHYTLGEDRAGDEVVIGWIGSASTSQYLEEKLPVLEQVLRRFDKVSLKVVSDKPVSHGRMRIINKLWSKADELADLHSFDIGIMPLPDNRWTRGKCGFKILQYLCVGTPAVASPVGINCQIVGEGVCGFLAHTDQQWIEHLSRLIQDRRLRRSLGQAGRELVKQRYSTAVLTPKYLEIFGNLMKK